MPYIIRSKKQLDAEHEYPYSTNDPPGLGEGKRLMQYQLKVWASTLANLFQEIDKLIEEEGYTNVKFRTYDSYGYTEGGDKFKQSREGFPVYRNADSDGYCWFVKIVCKKVI